MTKIQKELAASLHRTMPVKGCHSGRGWSHSERCFPLCYDSWKRAVQDMAYTLGQLNPKFDRDAWIALVTHNEVL